MKLRTRIVLTTLGGTVPLVAALVALDVAAQRRAAQRALADLLLMRLDAPGEQARCESAPGDWENAFPRFAGGIGLSIPERGARAPADGPPPPIPPPGGNHPIWPGVRGDGLPERPSRFFLHRARLLPRSPPRFFTYDAKLHPHAPAAPELDGVFAASQAVGVPEAISASWLVSEIRVLVRTPWPESACAFVLASGDTMPWLGGILPSTWVWLTPALVLFAAVLVAIGPAVRRIVTLTKAVQRSSASGYSVSVPIEGTAGTDEIAALARAFDAAARDVRIQFAERERRERALREFLANTTHDVMIPVTVLEGLLAALNASTTIEDPADRARVVAAMDEAHYMTSLLQNLAAIARLDSAEPRVEFGPVDLGLLVGRAIGRHRPVARQLDVALEGATPPEPVVVTADTTLLEQAVSNLVYNAVRHNRAGGHVAVILDQDGAQRFRLRVIDDGPGIAEAELKRLTERGYRGDEARTRAPSGQGLGLSIVQRVALLHDLTLTLRRSEYGGLAASLAGPLRSAPA